MDPVISPFHSSRARISSRQIGFGLIEAMISSVILIVGLAALAGLFAQSLSSSNTRGKPGRKTESREALEGVYTARNDGTIGWAGIQNTNRGGIFLAVFSLCFSPAPTASWGPLDKHHPGPPDPPGTRWHYRHR